MFLAVTLYRPLSEEGWGGGRILPIQTFNFSCKKKHENIYEPSKGLREVTLYRIIISVQLLARSFGTNRQTGTDPFTIKSFDVYTEVSG